MPEDKKDEPAPPPGLPPAEGLIPLRVGEDDSSLDDEDLDVSDDELEDDEDEDEDEAEEAELRDELLERVEVATERLAESPDDVAALLYRGEALDDLGDGDKAKKDLEKAAQLAPKSACAQLAWSRWLFGQGEEDRALDATERAIELGTAKGERHPIDEHYGFGDTQLAWAHYIRGSVLAGRDTLDEAL
ncbi:MAG: tetratricopeptide repeat protein, partial [Planctomycetota bacterium]